MALNHELLQEMYSIMLLYRRLDERAWILHRQGKIAFHISDIGHEAAQVGAIFALERGKDWVVPYYRDLAMMLALGYTPRDFMLGLSLSVPRRCERLGYYKHKVVENCGIKPTLVKIKLFFIFLYLLPYLLAKSFWLAPTHSR